MNELLVKVDTTNHVIQTNFDEIKLNVIETANSYKGIIVTEDSIQNAKKDLAELRKRREEIETKRKEVQKEWDKPYQEFKSKCAELTAIIDEPISEIKNQLDEFEKRRIAEKEEHLHKLYADNIEDYEPYLPYQKVFKKTWLNVSTKDKDILYDLSEQKLKVRADLDIIKNLKSDIESDLLEMYAKNDCNLAAVIQRHTDYLTSKEKAKEQVKEEVKATSQKPDIPFEKPAPIKQFEDLQNKINMVHFVVSAEDADAVEQFLQFSEITYRKE